jgi:3-hydroxyisobutyrate dehydrogenase-like beta-hydroxyacid dehydrogenase
LLNKGNQMLVAIVGVGEVGRCYTEALHKAGFELLLCDIKPLPAAEQIASSRGLVIHRSIGNWISSADWVISCVPGSEARKVAHQCVELLPAGAAIADVTTASPDDKRSSADYASKRAIRFVDSAIMGAIAASKERTPLLACGDGAQEFQSVARRMGAPIQVMQGASAGDAISLKMLRSVFTKGMEALCVEMLTAAEKRGLREQLYNVLSDIDKSGLRSFMEMLVRTHVVHAKRRAHEVAEAERQLALAGVPSLVLPGVTSRFLATASSLEKRPLPVPEPTVDQALQWLLADSDARG